MVVVRRLALVVVETDTPVQNPTPLLPHSNNPSATMMLLHKPSNDSANTARISLSAVVIAAHDAETTVAAVVDAEKHVVEQRTERVEILWPVDRREVVDVDPDDGVATGGENSGAPVDRSSNIARRIDVMWMLGIDTSDSVVGSSEEIAEVVIDTIDATTLYQTGSEKRGRLRFEGNLFDVRS